MEFINEEKRVKIDSISKSRIEGYLKCPYKVWKNYRDAEFKDSRSLKIGSFAHMILSKRAEAYEKKEEFNIDSLAAEINPMDMDIFLEVVAMTDRVDIENIIGDNVIISNESLEAIELPEVSENENSEGFRLLLKPDLAILRTGDDGQYIHIIEYKTGFPPSDESLGIEGVLYSWYLFQVYNLPVVFSRYYIRTGKMSHHEINMQGLRAMKPLIINLAKKYKQEMESEMAPEAKPSGHCLYCPFLESCPAKDKVDNMEDKLKSMVIHKNIAKKLESEVKEFAKQALEEVGKPEAGQETALIKVGDTDIEVVAKTSKSFSIPRKIGKKGIVELIEGAGLLENVIDHIDIKIDDEVASLLEEELGISLKPSFRTSISIKTS